MSRALLLIFGSLTLLCGTAAGEDEGIVFNVQGSPYVLGAAAESMGTALGDNNQQSHSDRTPSVRQFIVASTDRFPGSYFVERGNHYFQGASSTDGARPVAIAAGSGSHVEDLTGRLKFEAQAICGDLAENYREQPTYSESYCEAYRVWQIADEMATPKVDGEKTNSATSVRELDAAFQPVRRNVNVWGSAQPTDRALQARVNRAEALIHHLRYDVGAMGPDPRVARTSTAVLLHGETTASRKNAKALNRTN